MNLQEGDCDSVNIFKTGTSVYFGLYCTANVQVQHTDFFIVQKFASVHMNVRISETLRIRFENNEGVIVLCLQQNSI